MPHTFIAMRRRALVAASIIAIVTVLNSASAAACELAAVRSAIDTVLDKDEALAKKFRKEFAEGADPFTILDEMVGEEMRKKIDVCRFQAAEYLTKRGFPPSH